MGVVDGLLKIKRVRENACEQEVRRARTALDAATEALERAEQQRRERDEQRQAREREMVQRLCAAPVSVRDIEWTRVDIDGLRLQAGEDLKHEEAARALREQELEGVRAAIKARQAATRITEKFVSLAEREHSARLAEAERVAEVEMEDFKSRVLDLEDEAEAAL